MKDLISKIKYNRNISLFKNILNGIIPIARNDYDRAFLEFQYSGIPIFYLFDSGSLVVQYIDTIKALKTDFGFSQYEMMKIVCEYCEYNSDVDIETIIIVYQNKHDSIELTRKKLNRIISQNTRKTGSTMHDRFFQ